jgi:formylglycine-generating enzyme required for sulfatase activity
MVTLTGGTVTGSGTGGAFISGRDVTLSGFTIAKYETTWELWEEVRTWAGTHGYSIANPGREGHGTNGTGTAAEAVRKLRPVTTINWRDAIVWCNAYSEMSGRDPVYYTDTGYGTVLKISTNTSGVSTEADTAVMKPGANGYRLPTEAEWEYAGRDGNGGVISADKWAGTNAEGSLGTYAWYYDNSSNPGTGNSAYGAHPVGTKNPNSKGLYDMTGNVWEWCWDWHNIDVTNNDAAYGSPVTNPAGPSVAGSYRVVRGGSWDNFASFCALSSRNNGSPDHRSNFFGFRVVCP